MKQIALWFVTSRGNRVGKGTWILRVMGGGGEGFERRSQNENVKGLEQWPGVRQMSNRLKTLAERGISPIARYY
jgi:hypothetical protein